MPLLVEVSILLRQDLLVLVEEAAELVKLAVFEDLEAIESCSDFIRWRYLGHLGDRLVE